MTMWMVRSDRGMLFDSFLEHNLVALGWDYLPDLSSFRSRDEIVRAILKADPDTRKQSARVAAAMLWRFRNAIEKEDHIITYDPGRRVCALGRNASEYFYAAEQRPLADGLERIYPHRRKVEWINGGIPRDLLSPTARNSLGSTMSFFRIPPEVEREVLAVAGRTGAGAPSDHEKGKVSAPREEEADPYALETLEAVSRERIKDMVARLDWKEMQELVAGLLRAMGYKTRISPNGPDRGKDIIASPDGFGFEDPRIVVEVKHRPGTAIGAPEIRSFLGGRQSGEKGLYVSTGGFGREAHYEAERANIPMALMTLDDLVEVLLEYHASLDEHTRQLLPLRRIFWPID